MKANKILSVIVTLLLLIAVNSPAIADVVQRPVTNTDTTMVFDFAGVIPAQQRDAIADSLRSIYRSTSVEITVVTVETLGGMPVEDYAQELFNTWGIGNSEREDGVLVLVKPKTGDSAEGRGQVRIHTGYGAEGFLPDILCKHIQNDTIIPAFKRDDYAAGIMAAVNTIGSAARHEASATNLISTLKQQKEDDDKSARTGGGIVYFLIFLASGVIIAVKRLFPAEDGYPKNKSPLKAAQAELFLAKYYKEHPEGMTSNSSRNSDDDDYERRRRRQSSSRSSSRSSSTRSNWSFGGGRSGGGGASSSW